MNLSDFYYDLPKELIAQTPLQKRDESRLLIYNMDNNEIVDGHFRDILNYLSTGDCLILNNSKVLPARLFGVKKNGGAQVEILLLENKGDDVWEVMVRPGKRLKPGTIINIENGMMLCEVISIVDDGNRLVKFSYNGCFLEILDQIGQMPLPPYITEKLSDKSRYQTVYAETLGSAAAPTAGLHFTDELLGQLKDQGIQIGYVTLHIGLGTFRPVKVKDITDHKMHSEYYTIPQKTVDLVQATHAAGKRVVSVGTTSCRTLEGSYQKNGQLTPDSGYTDIFIFPGYKFNVIDALITNFHLPESTLLMLVSALVGRENILKMYEHAIEQKYRFFSFGDACLFIGEKNVHTD